MTHRNAFLLFVLCAITWGCATAPARVEAVRAVRPHVGSGALSAGGWRYDRSITNSSLPSIPPDSERSRWVTGMER
jgi:hypothetical protein